MNHQSAYEFSTPTNGSLEKFHDIAQVTNTVIYFYLLFIVEKRHRENHL